MGLRPRLEGGEKEHELEGTNRVRTLGYKSFLGLTLGVLAVLAAISGAADLLSPPSGAQAGPNLAVLSAGSSYYVSPTGNDSNPGTEAQPFRTIGKAATVVQPGSTVYIKAGTYREQVAATLSGAANSYVTFRNYGSDVVVVDGECSRGHGFLITGSWISVQGFTIKRTVEASILIDGSNSPRPANVTIDGMTLQDFDCTWSSQDPSSWGQFRGGVAAWYAGSGIRITNNLIRHRTSGEVRGSTDGIWFKSNDNNPSGGGHYIAGNTIIGGWDGIGGEEEGSAHGTFDRDTIVENNTIRDAWDDCIQVEGGDTNVRVRNNDLSGCGTGIAFAAPMSGPLYIENNTIHDLVTGLYQNHVCYKVGTNGSSSATTYLTGNSCDVRGGQEANGIHQSGGDNMTPIISRNNRYYVEGYVYYIGDSRGQDYDSDCMYKVNVITDNFVKWSGTYYANLAAFRAATGQEAHGQETANCSSAPTPTATATRTPTPSPTGTPGTPTPPPDYTSTPTPAYTTTPSPTTPSSPTDTSTPTPTPGEPPLMVAALSAGWNFQCYIGASRPIEEALAEATGKISAVYRLRDGGPTDRWFPDRPEVSTLTTVNPGDTLLLLTSDPSTWTQATSDAEPMVTLAPGWNGVCYTGGSASVEEASQRIDVPYSVIYALAPDQTWQRFVPDNHDVCTLTYLTEFTPVLILVTGDAGHWVLSP